jgi:DNA mismatch endonuclease, patch repair protein
MTPSPERSAIMRAIKGSNTAPELKIRTLLHRAGYRYRLHVSDLPGKPDLVFPSRRAVLFVHGCFWHGHSCKRGARQPKSNAEYWLAKIEKNRERDKRARARLISQGWSVHTIWECELNDEGMLARLKSSLGHPARSKG